MMSVRAFRQIWKLFQGTTKPLSSGTFESLNTWTALGAAFDTPRAKHDTSLGATGLFGLQELTQISGFETLKNNTLSSGVKITQDALQNHPGVGVVDTFDRLSDTLCATADLSEFVRLSHPDKGFRTAAEDVSLSISRYVESLNTMPELYDRLKTVLLDDSIELDEETRRVGELFLFDFEQSGIHLNEQKRKHFVELQEAVLVIGAQFTQGASLPVRLPLRECHQMEKIKSIFPSNADYVSIDTAFVDSADEKVREVAFRSYLEPVDEQIKLLDLLLSARHKLAQLADFPSFAHRSLKGTMVTKPERVMDFLKRTSQMLQKPARKEIELLTKLKQQHMADSEASILPWDLHFYSGLAKSQALKLKLSSLASYFSLGACMEGLSYLFHDLYGVRLVVEDAAPGELWSSDVQKVAVLHESEGLMGYIYCDFYSRPEKLQQDSHFTIRGGRQLSENSYQPPVVVVVCNFPHPSLSAPSLLMPGMVENLFHEMGHAMHSMLGRTRYQHVTGTRCSTDFAEVPSILMEYFFWDPRVLAKFARHYKTGQSPPTEMIEKLCQSKNMFGALEMERQVLYSMIDQVYHGEHPMPKSTTDILADVQEEFTVIPYISGCAWQQRFSHLNSYGAKYYSYLWSRAVASRIWHQCFAKDPFSRQMGERYRQTMLAHGGGKEPNSLVEDMLGEHLTTHDMVKSLWSDLAASNPLYM